MIPLIRPPFPRGSTTNGRYGDHASGFPAPVSDRPGKPFRMSVWPVDSRTLRHWESRSSLFHDIEKENAAQSFGIEVAAHMNTSATAKVDCHDVCPLARSRNRPWKGCVCWHCFNDLHLDNWLDGGAATWQSSLCQRNSWFMWRSADRVISKRTASLSRHVELTVFIFLRPPPAWLSQLDHFNMLLRHCSYSQCYE